MLDKKSTMGCDPHLFRIPLIQAANKKTDKNRTDSYAYIIIIEYIIEKKMFALS